MRVAILMSTYNGDNYISEQIDSILAQEGEFEIDLLVRDDGSTDSTIDILKNYEEKGLLKWYAGNNIGPARSFMELLIKYKDYDFYAFSDQDDYWYPDKIKKAIKCIETNRIITVYFSNAELVDKNLDNLGRTVYKVLPSLNFETVCCAGCGMGCTMVFDARLAKLIQSQPTPVNMIMHDYYLFELCLALGGQIIYDPRVCMKYRQHNANVVGVSINKKQLIKNRIQIIAQKNKISISDQAEEILFRYGEQISLKNSCFLRKVVSYNNNIINRIKLCFSREIKYMSFNIGLTMRLSILLGNR